MCIRDSYEKGDGIISFVRRAPDRLLRLLESVEDKVIEGAASDIFSIPKKKPKPSPNPDPEPDPVPEISKPKFKDSKLLEPYGFSIIKNPDFDKEVTEMRVKLGYEQEGGNWRKHDPVDFDLRKSAPIKIDLIGAEVEDKNINEIKFNISDQEFEIRIHGFDKNRDVRLAYLKV